MAPLAPLAKPLAAPVAEPASEASARKKAAQDFEALLLEKLLQSTRSGQSGPAADWRAMADRQLAQDLAKAGPLGVARLLEKKP